MNNLPPHNEESNDESSEKYGIVYLLTNPTMADLVKIGQTESSLENRVRELSRASGVPLPFQVARASKVRDCKKVESLLHMAFGDHRVTDRKEFFKVNPERVIAAMKLVEIENITPESDYAENKNELKVLRREQAQKAGAFKFSMVDINRGAILSFIKDEDNIKCQVHDDNSVLYNDELFSLSGLARKLLNEKFNHSTSSARGPDYWTYEEESLSARRMRMESEGSDE